MRNVVVRCCALLLGVAAVWASLDLAVEPYRKTVEYRHAEPCQRAAPRMDACIGRETGRVADKYTRTTTTGSTEDSSTETLYYLRIARDGRTTAYEVSNGLYGAARRGSRAGLDVWQGQVVGITVRGARDRLAPSAAGDLTFSLFPGWLGAGLLLWAALGGGRLRSLFGPLGTRAFAWVWLGLWTLLPAGRIAAHGTAGWGIVGWSVLWLFGAAVSVPFLFGEETGGFRAARRWRLRHRPRR
ncbi:hypothetical protein HMPREF1486_06323 [Streptomyces sp. HPH0547]|uniref:hypothetical protein n=1 Tax=Streptomyces TaxID=1883 RepID=UPI00034EA9E5|nr:MULTISPECIES: hypothetical protein [Streptomyces]EPD89381.1 hypothetical protein HMPREF1486_06323 [Streptomyces sp. HPH0547]GHJ21327.1 hypothetical protein TPA0909_29410 [Streptomyces albus]